MLVTATKGVDVAARRRRARPARLDRALNSAPAHGNLSCLVEAVEPPERRHHHADRGENEPCAGTRHLARRRRSTAPQGLIWAIRSLT